MNNHKKTKHPELNANGLKRGRGRPRKYSPNFPGDFETNKYDTFFTQSNRKKDETQQWEVNKVLQNVFEFLFEGEYKEKLISKHEKLEDNVLLHNLAIVEPVTQIDKKERKCDDVFYEYLTIALKETNEKYFILVLKFILLFRECFNVKNKKEDDLNYIATQQMIPETLPELCNYFYTEFMENNDFFGIKSDDDKNEIIEIIQHFCIWLFKNDYTKSKLSLA